MSLDPGDSAPTVSARNQRGEVVELDFAAPTVLYFYPRDDTSGCTIEAREFQSELERFRDHGVTVFGVSTDDADSHAAFAAEQGLDFDLLADPDGAIAGAFDVDLRGEDPPAAARTTFVLADGAVEAVYEAVEPAGHPSAVLQDLRESGIVDAAGDD